MTRARPPLPSLLAAALASAAAVASAQPAPQSDAAVATAPPAAPPAAPTPPQTPTAPPPAATAPAPGPVVAAPLAAPDAFTTPARDTGLPPNLWRGTSLPVVRAVLPLLADKPLPGAAGALARRVLATGAQGPDGTGADPALLALRARGLMTQGDPKSAAAILVHAPGLDRSPELARAAAESALLAGDDGRACSLEQGLGAGRDELYWVRLRAYCQAIAGKTSEAQLTFDIAQGQSADAVFARLMGAKLAGAGDPGAASLRNGLDYALSRNLGLDLAKAKPAPAVAAALAQGDPGEPRWDLALLDAATAPAGRAIAAGGGLLTAQDFERLLDAAEVKEPKARAHAQAVALIASAFAEPLAPQGRARLAAVALPEGRAPAGRNLTLDAAAAEGRIGETALLALWTSAEAPTAGLAPADRARIVRALHRVGLDLDSRAFALEGLLAP